MQFKNPLTQENLTKVSDNLSKAADFGIEVSQKAVDKIQHAYVRVNLEKDKIIENHKMKQELKELDQQHAALINPSARTEEQLSNINQNLASIRDKDKKSTISKVFGAAGKIGSAIVSPITFAAKTAGKVAVIATGVSVGIYATDEDKDIMDIPQDTAEWFEEHPEVAQAADEYILTPLDKGVSAIYNCTDDEKTLSETATCIKDTLSGKLNDASSPTESLPQYFDGETEPYRGLPQLQPQSLEGVNPKPMDLPIDLPDETYDM